MITNSELEILITGNDEINFAPESLEAELAQNIRTIFRTAKYSVPLDREFGLNTVLLDQPVNVAQALLTNEIASAIEKYEPRVRVSEIRFMEAQEGNMNPVIRVQIAFR